MLTLFDTSDVWTPIATRHRLEGKGKWVRVEGATMSLNQARRLREQGALVQALRYSGDFVTVVVQRRGAGASKR
jgi:hypothetical protein